MVLDGTPPTRISDTDEGQFVEVGAATINEGKEDSDIATIENGGCSIAAMPVWPQLHPLSVPDPFSKKRTFQIEKASLHGYLASDELRICTQIKVAILPQQTPWPRHQDPLCRR